MVASVLGGIKSALANGLPIPGGAFSPVLTGGIPLPLPGDIPKPVVPPLSLPSKIPLPQVKLPAVGPATGSNVVTALLTDLLFPAPVEPIVIPVVTSFSASRTRILSGEAITLTWATRDAIVVSINQFLELNPSGTLELQPTVTTTYELIAYNIYGIRRRSLTVTVVAAPPPPQAIIPEIIWEPGTGRLLNLLPTAPVTGDNQVFSELFAAWPSYPSGYFEFFIEFEVSVRMQGNPDFSFTFGRFYSAFGTAGYNPRIIDNQATNRLSSVDDWDFLATRVLDLDGPSWGTFEAVAEAARLRYADYVVPGGGVWTAAENILGARGKNMQVFRQIDLTPLLSRLIELENIVKTMAPTVAKTYDALGGEQYWAGGHVFNPDQELKGFAESDYDEDAVGKNVRVNNIPQMLQHVVTPIFARAGLNKYPAELPGTITSLPDGMAAIPAQKITNQVDGQAWMIDQMESMLGSWTQKIDVEMEDDSGVFTQTFEFPNVAEAMSEIMRLSMANAHSLSTLINMGLRTGIEAATAHKEAAITRINLMAIAEYLNFAFEEIEVEIPLEYTFFPSKEAKDGAIY